MRRLITLLAAVSAAAALGAASATAAPAPNPNAPIQSCFGIVSGQLASSQPGITGEHASSFDEPRLGIGNVAKLLGLGSVGELGSALAALDENPATFCP